jgi:type VI secretion system FHA domain protein
MPLQLEIISEHRDIVGDDAVREFRDDGGTIGRSLENDWILPDPDRFISGRHATIDHKGGIYYLLDTSTNGVYINDEYEPIGRGNPRRLFDGDVVRMGDFEMKVSLESGESLVMPLEPESTVVPDNIEQLVEEVSLRTGVKLLDEEEITGDDAFQSALFGYQGSDDDSDVDPLLDESNIATDIDIEKSLNEAAAKLDRIAEGPADAPLTDVDMFDAFLDGLGLSRAELRPDADKAEIMQNAGRVMREFVAGTTNLLSSRANLKNTFRLDQTTILPRHNNPMKLSENTNELVKQLLVGKEGEYLGARDAVREVCRDLLFHQNAFLDAMNSAFIEFADRFDPDELVQSFEETPASGLKAKFFKKSGYWDLYGDIYPILTEKGSGRFPQMFGEEFVTAYERQIAEYQRVERMDDGETIVNSLTSETRPELESLGDTRRFDPQAEAAKYADELETLDDAENDDPLDDNSPHSDERETG